MTRRSRRPGAVTLETALVYPVVFFIIMALVVGGLSVVRYQQVASLAREGARWASVHGGQYELEQEEPAATAADVHRLGVLPRAALVGADEVSTAVSWDDDGKMPAYVDASGVARTNRVRVTVTYRWLPELFLGGKTMTCTAEMPVTY